MKLKTRSLLSGIAKVILFLVLFFASFHYIIQVFLYKDSKAIDNILSKPNGSYDVILVGSSHMQFSLQPAQLFGEYGIASCNVATTTQSLPSSYHIVKEMIDRHDPELIVVDLFCLFMEDIGFSPVRLHQALDPFPLSLNKHHAIQDLIEENQSEYYFHFLAYHGRWKELTKEDFLLGEQINETYQLLDGTEAFQNDFSPLPVTDTAPIAEIPLRYLKQIVDLCRQTDTQLLLTVIPYRADVDSHDTSAIHQQRLFNKAAEYAELWGVDYLNGLHVLDEMDFDYSTDMIEFSHVNMSGAKKVSSFYGNYLRSHYDFPDRAQDPDYTHWYEDYQEYLNQFQ